MGLLTPAGTGRGPFVAALRERLADPPPVGGAPAVAPSVPCKEFFPAHAHLIRRMDRLSRLLCASLGSLVDEGRGIGDLDGVGLAVGTDLGTLEETFRFLGRLRDKGPALANPMDFPNLVPNAGAGYAGILLGLRGPCITFCNHDACGDDAVAWAAEAVLEGRVQAAVGGGAEEWGPVRARAQARLRGDHAMQGEGSAVVLFESPERAARRGAIPLARWAGTEMGFCAPRAPGKFPGAGAAPRLQAMVGRLVEQGRFRPEEIGVVLPSDPDHPAVRAVLHELRRPVVDPRPILGGYPADGALRVALGALLLADPTLAVDAAGSTVHGRLALTLTVARGGALRATLLERA
jgi:3-oxoacyl-(acyl-carrier-protein) synthase